MIEGSLSYTHTPLLLDYMLQPGHHLIWGQWAEAKPGASGLQRWDDLWQVVADQAEPSVFCKLLNNWKAKRGYKLMLQYRYGLNTLQQISKSLFLQIYVYLLPEVKTDFME